MEAIIAKLEAETEDAEWAQTTLKVHLFTALTFSCFVGWI